MAGRFETAFVDGGFGSVREFPVACAARCGAIVRWQEILDNGTPAEQVEAAKKLKDLSEAALQGACTSPMHRPTTTLPVCTQEWWPLQPDTAPRLVIPDEDIAKLESLS